MSEVVLTGEEMLAWSDVTAERWRRLGEAHTEMLELPCDVYTAKTVGELLQHIVAVELRYAERLAGTPETPYAAVPFGSAAAIYATHARAAGMLRQLLSDEGYDWAVELEFETISMGRMRATRKTILVHALMHGIRHYAQLATLVRQHGIKPDWPMDYLMMGAERV